jgi:hypothetical protein
MCADLACQCLKCGNVEDDEIWLVRTGYSAPAKGSQVVKLASVAAGVDLFR